MMAGPRPGAHILVLVLGALRHRRSFCLWDQLKFANRWSFDFLAWMVFEGRLWVSV